MHITDIAAWCMISFSNEYSNPLSEAHHLYLNGEEIKDLVIPHSVTIIRERAFEGCSYINTLTLPEELSIIKESAFHACMSLTEVVIPAKVEYIYADAFASCYKLNRVTSLAVNPPFAYDDTFSNYNIPLYVPDEAVNSYQETNPWSKFGKILPIGGFEYKLTYMVDGEFYSSYSLKEGDSISPVEKPIKEGYTFSGWSEIPTTMPASDVTITGTFTVNKYKLTYTLDGEEYKTAEVDYGTALTPEEAPVKEGYTFSGWSSIPETMPAKDVTVTGTFTVNKYKLTYMVDGEEYKSSEVDYGTAITPEAPPTKDGYTFSGWSEIPETMPASDVTITGTFKAIEEDLSKCATPNIRYGNKKLTFSCETEGVEYQYTITDNDIKTDIANEVNLSATYEISVYATKLGYENSDVATATLVWTDAVFTETTPSTSSAKAIAESIPVLISAKDGNITVRGEQNGLPLTVYTADGKILGSATMKDGQASISTNLQHGEIAIVKVGSKSVKIKM